MKGSTYLYYELQLHCKQWQKSLSNKRSFSFSFSIFFSFFEGWGNLGLTLKNLNQINPSHSNFLHNGWVKLHLLAVDSYHLSEDGTRVLYSNLNFKIYIALGMNFRQAKIFLKVSIWKVPMLLPKKLNQNISEEQADFTLFNLNIRSLNKNFDKLKKNV